jgi:hypothetical protein
MGDNVLTLTTRNAPDRPHDGAEGGRRAHLRIGSDHSIHLPISFDHEIAVIRG